MDFTIIDFIRNNIINKDLHTQEVIYYLEDGKMDGKYSDRMMFTDLNVGENCFSFKMCTQTSEKIHAINDKKEYISLIKDTSGFAIYNYQFGWLKSADCFTGYMNLISTSVLNNTMNGVVSGIFGIHLNNKELVWKETQLLFRDLPVDHNMYKSVAFESDVEFSITDKNKLHFKYLPHYYAVDPETLARILSQEQYLRYEAAEV